MRATPTWVDRVRGTDNSAQPVHSLCFRPDGQQLLVAAGPRVLVYDAADGTLIQPLKGHKDTVLAVVYAQDGKRFASGGLDKHVIVWTSRLEGILKFAHNDAILSLAFNPRTGALASGASSDFGLWASEHKSVNKHKISARALCISWSPDGLHLALGLQNGLVSIRSKSGEERLRIERGNNAPIAALQFSPVPLSSNESNEIRRGLREGFGGDILCVADWNQNLSFYSLQGKQVYKERQLGFDACCIHYFSRGEYILISGSNKSAVLFTKDGIRLGVIGEEQHQSWIWTVAARPDDSSQVILGGQDGSVASYQLVFSTVHGLYKERYAFRENMTDVIIQHLVTEQKVRIKCRDLVKKIAIYKTRLAVQLAERIVVYELYDNKENTNSKNDSKSMHYRVKEKLNRRVECNLLVVCMHHLVLCQEKRLQCLNFRGEKIREWQMDALIRYIKVVGGPPGNEGLLLGLKSGQVLSVFLENAFVVNVIDIGASVRCLDLSALRTHLAVVDEQAVLRVYELHHGQDEQTAVLQYQEPEVNSVAWNAHVNYLLAFSGPDDTLGIKSGEHPSHRQKNNGFVVGFWASKVFCLHVYAMSSVDVPIAEALNHHLEQKQFEKALQIAKLGATQQEWTHLAYRALTELQLDVATKCFVHLRDQRALYLVEELNNNAKLNRDTLMGIVAAFQNRFSDAARHFKRGKSEQRALAMYTDLRMFDLAAQFMDSSEDNEAKLALLRRKADWALQIGEFKAAAEMLLSAGNVMDAIEVMGKHKLVDLMRDTGRNKLDKAEQQAISRLAQLLKDNDDLASARELFLKVGDLLNVAQMHVDAHEWTEALALAEKHDELNQLVYLPYGHFLAEQDMFLEAQRAFHRAKRPDQAQAILEQLLDIAVEEQRFDDAAFYHWILALQTADMAKETTESDSDRKNLEHRFWQQQRMADIYYAYHVIEQYTQEPFTSYMPEALFNIARYLVHELNSKSLEKTNLQGISKFAIYFALAKQARHLGAFKLARTMLDKLRNMRIPQRFRQSVEMAQLNIRAKPYHDNDIEADLNPDCYRCLSSNPLLTSGNRCQHCGQNFVFSFVSFERLPLIEFKLAEGISDQEALSLIEASAAENNDVDGHVINGNVMHVENQHRLNVEEEEQMEVMDRSQLSALEPGDVIVLSWPSPIRCQFFRNVFPEVLVSRCEICNRLFHTDDFELQALQKGHCPFCRQNVDAINNDEDRDEQRSLPF